MTSFFSFSLFLQISILSSSFSLDVEEEKNPVNLVTICKGRNHKVSLNLKRMLASLMGWSKDVVVNLHVLTDEETQPWVDATIQNVIGRHLTEGVVFGFENNNVTLQTQYLDVDQFTTSIDRELLATMRDLFG